MPTPRVLGLQNVWIIKQPLLPLRDTCACETVEGVNIECDHTNVNVTQDILNISMNIKSLLWTGLYQLLPAIKYMNARNCHS